MNKFYESFFTTNKTFLDFSYNFFNHNFLFFIHTTQHKKINKKFTKTEWKKFKAEVNDILRQELLIQLWDFDGYFPGVQGDDFLGESVTLFILHLNFWVYFIPENGMKRYAEKFILHCMAIHARDCSHHKLHT